MNDSAVDTQHDLEGLPRHITFTNTDTTYQMRVSDTVLIVVSGTGEDATGIVTLPSLAEATGKTYFINAPTGSTGDDVSVYEKETGSELSTYGDLDADDDFVYLLSDGQAWRVIASQLG